MIAKLLISPSVEQRIEEIEKILIQVGLKNPHPDLLYFPSDSKLGIEQARKIKEHFSLKPYSAKGRGVVLEDASQLTPEAQNALLKTLEELPTSSLFILGANSDSKLLPTVISRCQIESLQEAPEGKVDSKQNYLEDIEKLLVSDIKQRFEYVEELKDRQEFLQALVKYFHQDLSVHPGGGHSNLEFLEELLQAEEWAKQNVNIRGILEYLMLVMPQKS